MTSVTGSWCRAGVSSPKIAKQERLKEMVMDKLIERELLTGMAEKLGFVVSDDEVDNQIADGKIVTLGGGAPVSLPNMQKDGRFSYESFKTFVPHPAPADAQRLRRSAEERDAGVARA